MRKKKVPPPEIENEKLHLEYLRTRAEIEDNMRMLRAKLQAHRRKYRYDQKNWGYVGDLGYIKEQLQSCNTFLNP